MSKVTIDRELLERIRELMHIIAHRQDDYGVEAEYLGSLLAKALANPTQQGEAVEVAWHTEDHLTDKSATTYDPEIAERWRAKGWPVTPLYTNPAASVPSGCKMVPVELLEQIAVELEHDNDRYFLGRELRALLASAEGGE